MAQSSTKHGELQPQVQRNRVQPCVGTLCKNASCPGQCEYAQQTHDLMRLVHSFVWIDVLDTNLSGTEIPRYTGRRTVCTRRPLPPPHRRPTSPPVGRKLRPRISHATATRVQTVLKPMDETVAHFVLVNQTWVASIAACLQLQRKIP